MTTQVSGAKNVTLYDSIWIVPCGYAIMFFFLNTLFPMIYVTGIMAVLCACAVAVSGVFFGYCIGKRYREWKLWFGFFCAFCLVTGLFAGMFVTLVVSIQTKVLS